jgi:peroxiredoxin
MGRYLKETVVLALIGVVTAGSVYLVSQNRALSDQNRLLARQAVEPRAGLYAPTLDAVTLDGDSVVLGQIGRRQLLFFFTHTCAYCRASVPAWNDIAQRLDVDGGLEVYGVALDSASIAAAYAAEQGLRFPVIAEPEPRLAGLYRVSGVPLVLILDEDGRMAYARLGVLESPAGIDSVVGAVRALSTRMAGKGGT